LTHAMHFTDNRSTCSALPLETSLVGVVSCWTTLVASATFPLM